MICVWPEVSSQYPQRLYQSHQKESRPPDHVTVALRYEQSLPGGVLPTGPRLAPCHECLIRGDGNP